MTAPDFKPLCKWVSLALFVKYRYLSSRKKRKRFSNFPDLTWPFSLYDIKKRIQICLQGCISCGMCSYPELTKDHVLTSAYVNIFRTVTRNAVNKSVWRKKDCFWLPLNKHTMNIFIQRSNSLRTRARFSENQSAPRLENRKTSPCIPCAPNLLHVLVSRILGYHSLCSPGYAYAFTYYGDHYLHHDCTIHAPSFLCFFIFCGGQTWNVSSCIFYSWRPQMITTTRSEHIQIILSKKCGAMKWHVFGE